MNDKNLVVQGFVFNTKKEYELAKEEEEAIAYLRENTDLSKPKSLLKLYQKLNNNKTFQTPIGYFFLKELKDKILSMEVIPTEELEDIAVSIAWKKDPNEFEQNSLEGLKQRVKDKTLKIRNLYIIIVFLCMILVTMVIISIYKDKTLFTDYQNELLDKYSTWEETLKIKEDELTLWETELNQKNEDEKE